MSLFVGRSSLDELFGSYLVSVHSVVEKIVLYSDIGLVAGDYPRGIMAMPYYEFKNNRVRLSPF